MELNKIHKGDCLEVLKTFPDNSIDAIVTDPPYGLSFMGKHWDYDVPSIEIWKECIRVLKPGGYLLSFAGTRTQHRMACNIEDAGFEIRDMIAWVYGSGFPKSLNIGKAVDKLQGNERKEIWNDRYKDGVTRQNLGKDHFKMNALNGMSNGNIITKGTSEWEGWGTALKPALEPITVARKPLSEKSVAENVLRWGTGGINIDGSRVEYQGDSDWENTFRPSENVDKNCWIREDNSVARKDIINRSGRFPANFIHDGSDEVVELFPNNAGGRWGKATKGNQTEGFLKGGFNNPNAGNFIGDHGSASRFFYCAKASKTERNRGCEDMEVKKANYLTDYRPTAEVSGDKGQETPFAGTNRNGTMKNNHPTVKPIALMEYLVKLVSKEGALILDPFTGSGSTLIACKNLKRNYIGIEREPEYITIAQARLSSIKTASTLF